MEPGLAPQRALIRCCRETVGLVQTVSATQHDVMLQDALVLPIMYVQAFKKNNYYQDNFSELYSPVFEHYKPLCWALASNKLFKHTSCPSDWTGRLYFIVSLVNEKHSIRTHQPSILSALCTSLHHYTGGLCRRRKQAKPNIKKSKLFPFGM